MRVLFYMFNIVIIFNKKLSNFLIIFRVADLRSPQSRIFGIEAYERSTKIKRKSEMRMTRGQKEGTKDRKPGDNEIEIFCRAHKILRAVFWLLLELELFLFQLFVRPGL